MHLTLRQMKVFEAAARHLSFTRAGAEIGLSQPAVSQVVRQLEDNLGTPLFEQVGKRLFLTPAGERLRATCHSVAGEMADLEQSLSDLRGGIAGPLAIAGVTTTKYLAPHLLGAFVRRYPLVRPRLVVTNRDQVIERLRANADDLVLMGQVPETLAVESVPVLANPLVVAAPPDHPLAGAGAVPLARLAEEAFLMREPGSGTRMVIEGLLAECGLRPRVVMELGSGEAIKQAVMAGLGISVLSAHSLRLEVAAGLIRLLPVEGFPQERQWYAVKLRDKRLHPVARRFLDFLRDEGAQVIAASRGLRPECDAVQTKNPSPGAGRGV